MFLYVCVRIVWKRPFDTVCVFDSWQTHKNLDCRLVSSAVWLQLRLPSDLSEQYQNISKPFESENMYQNQLVSNANFMRLETWSPTRPTCLLVEAQACASRVLCAPLQATKLLTMTVGMRIQQIQHLPDNLTSIKYTCLLCTANWPNINQTS